MTYQKLCQLYADNSTGTNGQGQDMYPAGGPVIYYLEDCNGNVMVNNIPSFPITIKCEVITFNSVLDFQNRAAYVNFTSATAAATALPIRSNVFSLLTPTYPNLNE
jgi:hypothetical protein